MIKNVKVDATIMMYSDSKLRTASAYHRGGTDDLITLLAVAGKDNARFGKIIMNAAMIICGDFEKRGIPIGFTKEELNEE